MAEYGEIFNSNNSGKELIYKAFDDYFNHPIMFKIKNINNLSMYICKIYCLLTNNCRYIIVFVKQNYFEPYTKISLINLNWISLQTRTLAKKYNIPSHNYQPIKKGPLNVIIQKYEIKDSASIYSCNDLAISVTLLHDKNEKKYQEKGNVIAAIETYNTIIMLE